MSQSLKAALKGAAAASPFAHLLGLPVRAVAAAAEDKKDDARRAEEDDEDRHEEEDDKEDGKKGRKARAESDDEEMSEEECEDDGEDDGKKKSRKARAESDDKDDEDEDEEDDDYAKGRKAERARWTQVLKSPAAGSGRLPAACQLLFGTNLKASAIIETLSALPVAETATVPGLRARMASAPQPKVGPDGGKGAAPTFADEMKAAVAIVRPAQNPAS